MNQEIKLANYKTNLSIYLTRPNNCALKPKKMNLGYNETIRMWYMNINIFATVLMTPARSNRGNSDL